MNKYYQKIFNEFITKVWEDEVKKPIQNLSYQEYAYYQGSRDFLLKLRIKMKEEEK